MRTNARFLGRTGCIGLAITLLVVQFGCGDGPTAPDLPVVGSWVGTFVDERAGAGVVELNLENDYGTHLAGSWSVTVAQSNFAGPLTGTAATTPILLNLRCNAGGQGAAAMFVTLEGGTLRGQHLFYFGSCTSLSSGTVELSKR